MIYQKFHGRFFFNYNRRPVVYLPTKEDGAAEQGTIQGTPLFVMKEFFKKMLIFFDYVGS